MQPSRTTSDDLPGCSKAVQLRGKLATSFGTVLIIAALGCDNETTSPTRPEPAPQLSAASTAGALQFHQVSAGYDHSCGVTADSRAYCWGRNNMGQLGDGTLTNRTRPVPVAGGLSFLHVSAGVSNSCGITTSFQAFCWGEGGENGDGTTAVRRTPALVAGGHSFRQVDVGGVHTCAVSRTDRRAYCWGRNPAGQLGNGSTTVGDPILTPVAVTGSIAFRQVAAGYTHSCGVTTSEEAYCWGSDDSGQLGDDSEQRSSNTPVRVAGTHRFIQIDGGNRVTCAVTAADRAFCWGWGKHGQIGDGSTLDRYTPRTVHGLFTRISVGDKYACGETSTNLVKCWGDNDWGQFGNGTTDGSLSPIPGAEGRHFSQISTGRFHTCGRTAEGEAWCWGNSSHGRVGDGIGGSGTMQVTPVRVVDP